MEKNNREDKWLKQPDHKEKQERCYWQCPFCQEYMCAKDYFDKPVHITYCPNCGHYMLEDEIDKETKVITGIIEGYLYNGNFYEDSYHIIPISGMNDKIYVDLESQKVYRYSRYIKPNYIEICMYRN